MPDRQTLHQSGQRAPAARYRSIAWEDGYVTAMAGLGDACPCPEQSVQAIEWEDGHGVAMKALRLVEEDYRGKLSVLINLPRCGRLT